MRRSKSSLRWRIALSPFPRQPASYWRRSGLTPGLNQPRITQRVEQVLADAFHAQARLVQGAELARCAPGWRLCSTGSALRACTRSLPTTRVIIEQMADAYLPSFQ
ncbi:hypothetical protein ACVXHB_09340 [Escherichia coli]